MPLLWRYLIAHFLKTMLASVIAFVAILLSIRLDEIAHFATLGAPLGTIFLFTFHQIPYILPIALPLGCLISAVILFKRLSHSQELTALRASGFSITAILKPILVAAAFLSLLNFWMISEVATHSHLQTNLLKNQLRSINPLLLLNNKHLMRLKGLHFDALGASHVGESAEDIILALPNESTQRLNLFVAKSLSVTPTSFTMEKGSLIVSKMGKDANFDDLFIENIGTTTTHVKDFADMLQKKTLTINSDYLKSQLLAIRIQEQRRALATAQAHHAPPEEVKLLRKALNQSYVEVFKRASIAIAVFTLTLLGAAFSLTIGRQRSVLGILAIIGFTLLYLVCFFVAKGADQNLILAGILYLAPHGVITLFSIRKISLISKGREGWAR